MSKPAIRIAIADDEPFVLAALASLIRRQRDMDLVGSAAHASALLELVDERSPDVVLTDLRMPGDVTNTIRSIDRKKNAPAVIVFSAFDEVVALHASLEAGATAFILKDLSPREILCTVRDHATWRAALLEAGSWTGNARRGARTLEQARGSSS
jgi:DNA-binding NarL/FixJ family response regulator